MTSLSTSTAATEKVVDVVTSQAVEIAKDVALPAASFVASRFFRTRAKSIVALFIVGSAIAVLIKRKKGSESTSSTDRPPVQESSDVKESV